MIVISEFHRWMSVNTQVFSNHNQAWLAFLTDVNGKGFIYIKDYNSFCHWGKIAKQQYGYAIDALPCSELDFGQAVLKATPEVFEPMMPALPETVKIELMAEKFHQWVKNKPQSNFQQKLYDFLNVAGVLEQIQTYADFCQLAEVIDKKYYGSMNHTSHTALDFYRIVFSSQRDYWGAQPLEVPDDIMKILLEPVQSLLACDRKR